MLSEYLTEKETHCEDHTKIKFSLTAIPVLLIPVCVVVSCTKMVVNMVFDWIMNYHHPIYKLSVAKQGVSVVTWLHNARLKTDVRFIGNTAPHKSS